MIYLYAIAGQFDSSLDPPPGIENQGVYQINCRSFAPVLSTLLTTGEVNLSKEAIYTHENIVEFFMKHTSILPVRFNALFDSTEALTDTLKRYSLEIETNLLKVSNCVEMGVKILAKEDKEKNLGIKNNLTDLSNQVEKLSKAKKYILDKFAIHKEAFYLQEIYKEQGESIYTSLNEYSKLGIKFPIATGSHLILNSVFLILKDSLSSFKNKFQEIKQNNTDFAFLLSGPWPPYNFVDFHIEKTQTGKENIKNELCLS